MSEIPKVWNKRDPHTPADAVYVGRPSEWGNPFRIVHPRRTRERAIQEYRDWINGDPFLATHHGRPPSKRKIREELKGQHLVCWCAPKACHADVLLEIANAPPPNLFCRCSGAGCDRCRR